MKITVKRACGHEEIVEVFGTAKERESKIKWYESTDCTECYSKEKNSGCEEVEMKYSEYKNDYSECSTKANSYNKFSKTIIVYVPKTVEEIKEEVKEEPREEITLEQIAKTAGSTVEVVKVMIAKTNDELESQYIALKNKLISINHPQKDALIDRTRKSIDMIYKYKAQ